MLPWKRELGFWLNSQEIFIRTKIMSLEFENILKFCLSGGDLINFFLEGKTWVLKPLQTDEDLSPCFSYSGSILWDLHPWLEECYCYHLPFLVVHISSWIFSWNLCTNSAITHMQQVQKHIKSSPIKTDFPAQHNTKSTAFFFSCYQFLSLCWTLPHVER